MNPYTPDLEVLILFGGGASSCTLGGRGWLPALITDVADGGHSGGSTLDFQASPWTGSSAPVPQSFSQEALSGPTKTGMGGGEPTQKPSSDLSTHHQAGHAHDGQPRLSASPSIICKPATRRYP